MDVVMFHDLRREHFALPLDHCRLTFDDGLFSHYYYLDLFRSHLNALTFFITTSFIRDGKARPVFSGRYIEYREASFHTQRAMIDRDFSGFMTVEEVQHLAARPNVRIGAHSHFHDVTLTDVHPKKIRPTSPWRFKRFPQVPADQLRTVSIRSRLAFQGLEFRGGRLQPRSEADWEDFIRRDTERCLEWFARHLNHQPDLYGFPFNEYSPRLIAMLKGYGFKEFYAGSSVKHAEVIGRTDAEELVSGRL
ncbi:MAG: polysaccharide deacetylase family protein [Desulfobacterales bacterium]|jgi:peptidoglycan/xylan/chitin deacetylase (PgdA/CDA1 family)|nr:polysaccharide deacetylase family protein [Desulfobacterales bacterium]